VTVAALQQYFNDDGNFTETGSNRIPGMHSTTTTTFPS